MGDVNVNTTVYFRGQFQYLKNITAIILLLYLFQNMIGYKISYNPGTDKNRNEEISPQLREGD